MTEYKSLEHGSTLVTVTDLKEQKFITQWLKDKGVPGVRYYFVVKYPIYIGTKDGAWTDRGDRAAYYISFKEFLSKIGY